MKEAYFIAAIGTPLTEDEQLHEEGLVAQLQDVWNAGMSGVLVAGTMGALQLLTDETFHRLIERTVEVSKGKGELLAGASDAGFTRTRDRIRYLSQFPFDGIAVLAPYFWRFPQDRLVAYFQALADESPIPLYLYDLPPVVITKLSLETVLELSKHPNIHGVKASCDFEFTRQVRDRTPEDFRVIAAQPNLMDVLLRHGANEQLDGMWAVAPRWTIALGRCAAEGDWAGAAEYQRKITDLRNVFMSYSYGCFSDLMNARGIPGIFAPLPFARMTKEDHDSLLAHPIVQQLVEEDPAQLG